MTQNGEILSTSITNTVATSGDIMPRQRGTERKQVVAQTSAELLIEQLVEHEYNDKWQIDALCAETDPDVFHPKNSGSAQVAKRVCLNCDVRLDCLGYALDKNENQGVWGGLNQKELEKLRKSIKRAG